MKPIVTKAVPYEPPPHLVVPAIEGLRWVTREVDLFGRGSETQYLVMHEDGVNVLSSGFTAENAAASAVRMLAYLKLTPDHYFPRLIDFRFEANTAGSVVQHLCVSPNGDVWGSDIFRKSAARQANMVVLSRLPVRQLTFGEFQEIAFSAEVIPGRRGARERATLYTQVGEGEEIKKALGLIWTLEPRRPNQSKADFIKNVEHELFNMDLLAGHVGASFEIPMGPGALHLVVHQPRISRDVALRTAYAAAQSASRPRLQLDPAPTEPGGHHHRVEAPTPETRNGGAHAMRQRA